MSNSILFSEVNLVFEPGVTLVDNIPTLNLLMLRKEQGSGDYLVEKFEIRAWSSASGEPQTGLDLFMRMTFAGDPAQPSFVYQHNVPSNSDGSPISFDHGSGRFYAKDLDNLVASTMVGVQAVVPANDPAQNSRMILAGLGVMVIEATDPIDLVMYQFRPDQWVRLKMTVDEAGYSPELDTNYVIHVSWQEAGTLTP